MRRRAEEVIFFPMEWGQVITIIFGVSGFMAIFMFLFNKRVDTLENRIDDLRRDMDRRFEDLRHDMDRRFEALEKRLDRIEELLYRALGVERKG